MNEDLGLKVLSHIMSWTNERARQEFGWLRLMARLKYDDYQDFQAGMRFIESLVTWLQQFDVRERETAYNFVRHTLVYIGRREMQQLVKKFYPRTVQNQLVQIVADECGIQPYLVFADTDARAAEKRLRRQILFMGLSDGAHIDTIRHANTRLLSNEQFVQVTQIDIEKWKDLLDNLRKDLDDSNARFRLVYLIDDFTATGTSFLRFDEKKEEWRGKLIRFRDSVEGANDALDGDKLFDEGWQLCIHHYMASHAARGEIKERLEKLKANGVSSEDWGQSTHLSFGTVLPRHLPINVDNSNEDFVKLTQKYYDPILRTKHTDVGGVQHLGLGYGACALPLVLEHNTPNNSVALLWAETAGGNHGGVQTRPMRPLFRRRHRHV